MSTQPANKSASQGRPAPPKDWIPGLVENGKTDIVSGFIIFLIALPLCLGIAIASGAPPIAGIITGIVAGTLANLLSGSYVTINGPAAGMIAIVAGAVTDLGFQKALAVGVVAGVLQTCLAFVKAGKMTGFFPLSVIHGMLAGIGLIIMAGQIHVVLGLRNPREHELKILTSIVPSLKNIEPSVAVVGIVAVVIMVVWPLVGKYNKIAKVVPAPLVAVIAGTVIAIANGLKDWTAPAGVSQGSKCPKELPLPCYPGAAGKSGGQLLNLGDGLIKSFTENFQGPDFAGILSGPSIKWIFLYLFVASLESLLTAEAVDKLDPYQRRSNMNRELFGKGIGNTVCGLIGGLPMIAEVVRSKANILNGAKTRWSNFFHGIFLLIFVIAVPGLLEKIPLSALAGILLVIGFRLAHPKEFLHAYHIGKVEFVLMFVTAFTVLLTDLLLGVAAGIVLGLVHALFRGTSLGNLFKPKVTHTEKGDTIRVDLARSLGFHNFIPLRSTLDNLPLGRHVTLDFTGVKYIDPTVMERLHDFAVSYVADGGTVERTGESGLRAVGQHEMSIRVAK